jgi:serine/threonine protein phosphatase PrpC
LALLDAHGCWIVADGMGGHVGGGVASRVAVDAITASVQAERAYPGQASDKHAHDQPSHERTLKLAILSANDAVRRHAASDASLAGMGTTVVVLRIYATDSPTAVVAHVGDSRIYVFRSQRLTQLTPDHSLVEEYRRQGRLSAQEALSHPLRHVLSRAVGPDADVEPETSTHLLQGGDRFLLCTDGLTKMLEDGELAKILEQARSVESACRELVDQANDRGGEDNVTAVVVDWTAKSGDEIIFDKKRPGL